MEDAELRELNECAELAEIEDLLEENQESNSDGEKREGDGAAEASASGEEDEEASGSEDEAEANGVGSMPVEAGYQLVAVVSHVGSSASSGHYISDVCDAKSRLWRRFDDSLVTQFGEKMPKIERERWHRNCYLAVYAHLSCFEAA